MKKTATQVQITWSRSEARTLYKTLVVAEDAVNGLRYDKTNAVEYSRILNESLPVLRGLKDALGAVNP